ncbi:MAG: alpha-hydroxy-acid oxidizing protein [Acidobacteria bacterium]|nr:alpha-hydroxy-acid oxidizing protein [Acidobacteriota bacterium]
MSNGPAPSFRREFLRFLAASPLFAQPPAITDPKDAINVMDFELLAQKALPPAHWGFLASGVNGDVTLRRNVEAMDHYQLRARRLSGVAAPDLSSNLFGENWTMPFYLSAVGLQRQYHPDAELVTARAAKEQRAMVMLSTTSSQSIEAVTKAYGAAPWYQLYMPRDWGETEKMVRRVESTGCRVMSWTVDTLAGRRTETSLRFARTDTRNCMGCHRSHPITGSLAERNRHLPMFAGLSGEYNPPNADWTYLDRLKKMTSMKVLIKGIDTAEDAVLAREHGADGVIVSNHGGRATETGRGTMEILPEVIDAVKGQIPVLVDGGFRRGTDILKALAIGARAVGIGRPYIWGLAAFGQPGVERVVQILRAELAMIMQQIGTGSISQINRAYILRNGAKL